MSDLIVKNISFGKEANEKVFSGVEKLALAVGTTLGGGGKCVMVEDSYGNPVITKDGVTIADSITLLDPVENMGATLLKEAARKTVREAGDGTTTATVLAYYILKYLNELENTNEREIKRDVNSMLLKIVAYLEEQAVQVDNNMLNQIASIATNNNPILGKLIGDAFKEVGNTGVVMMELSDDSESSFEVKEGAVLDMGLTNNAFITNRELKTAELDNPYILLVDSPIDTIAQIETVLTYIIKSKKSLLIIADVDPKVQATLAMNNLKGNIKINVINAPTFGINRKEVFEDIALLTGSTLFNEDLGDDLDLIDVDSLGRCVRSSTDYNETALIIEETSKEVNKIISGIKKSITKEKNPNTVVKLEKRLARLNAKVALIKVGANSPVELKELSDRVEDAICATKAAIKSGVIPGGGVALMNAARKFDCATSSNGEKVLLKAINEPFNLILQNAGIEVKVNNEEFIYGVGIDVVTGLTVNMVEQGIIDPLLVTKSALINAVSVATTIYSTNCVINNLRVS